MGLGLLVPAFLIGLAALMVPLLIHLRHRERRPPIKFPSLMFLERVPHRSAERRRVTHWLLLLLRAAAVSLLVVAFARPFFHRGESVRSGASRSRREVALVLDRSMSMGYSGLWATAIDSARRVLDALRPGDRAALVLFDETAVLAAPLTDDLAAVRGALAAARPGPRSTRFGPALRVARDALDPARDARREMVLLSDFQRGGLEGLEELSLPAGTALRPVPLGPADRPNAAVISAELDRTVAGNRVRLAVAARVASKGGPPRATQLALTVNGREVARQKVMLLPNAVTTTTFDPLWIPDGPVRGTVRLEPDALPADDELRFAVAGTGTLRVLLVTPPDARPGETLYLGRALAIGRRPRLDLIQRTPGQVGPRDLAGARAAILVDVSPASGRLGSALRDLVERGGGLILVAGPRLVGRNATGAGPALLPATIGAPVDRAADRGGTLGYLNRDHPALEPFRASGAADFGTAHFLRYRLLVPGAGAEVVARFDDGRPALVEGRVGRGRVLVFASALDGVWTDLPLEPVFLPLIQRLVLHAAGFQAERPWRIAGELAPVPAGLASPVVRAPDGTRRRFPPDSARGGLRLDALGFYEIAAGTGVDTPVTVVAVNPSPEESDLARAYPRELTLAVRVSSDSGKTAKAEAPVAPGELEREQALWRMALLAGLMLLAAETVYSNRLSRASLHYGER